MARRKKKMELVFPMGNQFHPSFEAKMIAQLTESGSQLLEESITNCVFGISIDEDEGKFDSDGNGYMKCSIIDWSSSCRDVTVKWRSSTKIYPIKNVEDIDITFSWCEDFPTKSLKMSSKKKTVIVDSETYPFKVEYSGFIESDIYFEIRMSKPKIDNESLIVETLKNASINWNINSEKTSGPHINYMSNLIKRRNKYIIFFDLGSSGLEAIHCLLHSLANELNIDISKISVKQA